VFDPVVARVGDPQLAGGPERDALRLGEQAMTDHVAAHKGTAIRLIDDDSRP
jgi:hypothetical protein